MKKINSIRFGGLWIAAGLGLYLNLRHNPEVSISLSGFRPHGAMLRRIAAIGVPSVIMMSIGSVMTFLMNQILIAFSATAVAVFGAYFKLQSFVFMPVFGLNNGTIPIIAFNYGAGNRKRMTRTVGFAMVLACSIMALGTLLMWLMPETMLRLFDASDDMMAIGVPALERISLCFVPAGFCIAMGSVFQAVGRSYYSMIVSFARQLIVLLPAAWLLSKTGAVENVWWAFPIAEIVSVIVSSISYHHVHHTLIRHVGEEKEPQAS